MFDKYFEIFLADTLEAQKIHYNIRYQVYCEELGYEDPAQFPDQLEFDKWDPKDDHNSPSKLFLVRLKHTGQWVGAMRLVPHNGELLPLEETTSLDHTINHPSLEISRLCIVKEIRRPYIENSYGINENDSTDISTTKPRQADPEDSEKVELFYSNSKVKSTIIWGLFNATLQYSQASNFKNWYLLSSKALVRIIGRQGFTIKQVGPTCEHRGKRAPYLFNVDEIANNPIWGDFKKQYRLHSALLPQAETTSMTAMG